MIRRRRLTAPFLLAAWLTGCREPAPRRTIEPAPSASSSATTASGASSRSAPAPVPTAFVSTFPSEIKYETYGNTRFEFTVDVPTFFVAEPAPTNGDGLTWIWGSHATMTAAGGNNDSLTTAELCKDWPKRPGVKASSITKNTCWITGIDAGEIYWERTVLSGDFLFELSFRYDERLKKRFDPIVAHVNASWKPRKCDANRIDACGLCFLRCRTSADCAKGEACQPVTCWTPGAASFGRGCVNPDDEFSVRAGMLMLPADDANPDE